MGREQIEGMKSRVLVELSDFELNDPIVGYWSMAVTHNLDCSGSLLILNVFGGSE